MNATISHGDLLAFTIHTLLPSATRTVLVSGSIAHAWRDAVTDLV